MQFPLFETFYQLCTKCRKFHTSGVKFLGICIYCLFDVVYSLSMKNLKQLLFSDRDFYRKLIHIAFPVALQNLMLSLVAAADALMLGSVEQNSMAAVSLATQIQFIQNMLLYGISSVGSILGAQYWGKKDTRTLKDIFAICLKLCIVIDGIFWLGCMFFPRYLMLIFTNDEELVQIGIHYLKIASWSYLFTGISQCYHTMMKVSEHSKQSAIISSVTVIINIILNTILIYGLCGFPTLGVRGAAIATLITRIIELLWCVALSYKKSYIHPSIKRFFVQSKELLKDFFKCLFPLLGASLFWGVGFTSYTAFIGHLGADAAASNSIASVVRDLVCCFCNGTASGGGILVGNELGAGKLEKGKLYGDRLAWLSAIVGIASTCIMLILTPVVMHFIKLTDGAHSLLQGMMVIMAIYMIGRTMNTVIINGVFAAGGDTIFDMYSLAVAMWGIAVPLAFLGTFVFHWPVLVVYACTCVDEVGKIPWTLIHFRKYKWVKDLTKDLS